jgi:hypothetical protein
MSSGSVIPAKLLNQLREELGPNPDQWPQELRDIFDTSIVARALNAPISGLIRTKKNTSMHYHWAKDLGGINANHERVEELRALGWEYATTEDVEMFNDFTVKNRRNNKPDGFSNEIRNGDLRMMKIPMVLWRQKRKFEVVSAFQMAYPQAYGVTGKPMSAENLVPGLKNYMITDAQDLTEFESHFRKDNTSVLKVPKET